MDRLGSRVGLPHLLLGLLAILSPFVVGLLSPTPAAATEPVTRIRGEDRVATSVAVARAGWTSAAHVLVTTARNYPDAIAASAYAASLDAPVLLTEPDVLSPAVADVLGDLGARRVTILGGTNAVSRQVEDRLLEEGMVVDRIAGSSRWETAADLATSVDREHDVDVVAIALGDRGDGHDAWPDALAAASLAALDVPVPTLLTRRDALPAPTVAALDAIRPSKVLVLGGEFAIPEKVMAQLRKLGHAPERIDGPNRYATSVAVAQEAMRGPAPDHGDLDPTKLVAVSGAGFADALGAGALAARRGAPLLLVPVGRLDDAVDQFVRAGDTNFSGATVVGGPGAVQDFVLQELRAAITGEPRPAPPCPANSSPDCQYTYRHPIQMWEDLAKCEAHGNWAMNSGNGYYGGLQFHPDTWRGVGGQGLPHQNSKWEQIHRGEILQERSGWGQWPHCSRQLGYR